MKVGPTASQPDVGVCQMQRRLGQHQQRAGHHQIVALDEADEGEDCDDRQVVSAERDTVELAAEHKAGTAGRRPREKASAILTSQIVRSGGPCERRRTGEAGAFFRRA
jgi:hypothetical protein